MLVIILAFLRILFPPKTNIAKKTDMREMTSIHAIKSTFFPEAPDQIIEISPEDYDLLKSLIFEPKYRSDGKFLGDSNSNQEQIKTIIFIFSYKDNSGKDRISEYRISNMGNIAVLYNYESNSKKYKIQGEMTAFELFDILDQEFFGEIQDFDQTPEDVFEN